jgi:hypothetical protein
VEDDPISQENYIHQVLSAYRQTPGTAGTIRRPDRLLAAQLYARGVPLRTVENALVLAASRRLVRPTGAPPLATIRSLAYFLPVISRSAKITSGTSAARSSPSCKHRTLPDSFAAPTGQAARLDDAKPTRTPAAWMMMLFLSLSLHILFQMLFSVVVTSTEHYWVTLAERRSTIGLRFSWWQE